VARRDSGVTVIASMMVQQTERGDEMFTAMPRRTRSITALVSSSASCQGLLQPSHLNW